MVVEHLLGHPLDVVDVGHVAAVDLGDAAGGLDLLLGLLELLAERATNSTVAPASAALTAVALPIPEEPPVISTTLPRTAPLRVRSMKRSGSRWRSQ